MSRNDLSTPFSKKALKALEQVLKEHRALIWVDPTTNNLSVKRMIDHAEGVLQKQQLSSGASYA